MVSNKCAVCWKDDAKRCGTCKSCSYCSKECQKSDWQSHKLLCKTIATEPPRPSSSHLRAIYFPDDKQAPQLVWIHCSPENGIPMDPGLVDMALLRKLTQRNEADTLSRTKVWRNNRLKKETSHMIEFHYRDNFYNDGSRSTASLNAVVKPHGPEKRDWRGPLVVLAILIERAEESEGADEADEASLNYRDMTLADFRSVIDYSLGYERYPDTALPPALAAMGFQNLSLEPDVPTPPPTEGKRDDGQQKSSDGGKPAAAGVSASNGNGDGERESIMGVQLNCQEQGSTMCRIKVARTHPIRNGQGEVSPISRLVGMPLRLRKNQERFADWGNQTACWMMVDVDIDNEAWGFAPMQWQLHINNVLAVREDGQDLTVQNVMDLHCFCADFLDVVQDAAEVGTRAAREEAMEFLTPENYQRKIQEYRTNSLAFGD
ncbi:hypothetical protein F4818DRAFT_418218 [Hypoxylon cercidicola]|nr:hypothetical protein F4818DRAFT_418218 [Hypoxylon cercidicola]